MNQENVEVFRRKPVIIYKYEYEINESCLTCKHFLWSWDDIPFCALGKTIYGYCTGETRGFDSYG